LEKIFYLVEFVWTRSIWEKPRSLAIIKFGEGEWVLTLEVLRTFRVQIFFMIRRKGDKFPKVLGSEVNLDHPSSRTRVHISEIVQNFGYLEELECG